MSTNLKSLMWFDVGPVIFTFLTILIIQYLNGFFTKSCLRERKTSSENSQRSSTSSLTANNGQHIETQTNERNEDKSSSSPISTPNSSARNSFNSSNHNGIQMLHTPSIDSLGDEYHEDEDTLSLDNLFPCDQSEIYASKKICFIIDELIQTESNYVNNMRKGMANYGQLHKRTDLPECLKDAKRQNELLGSMKDILKLHGEQVLPMMMRNQRDLKQLFDELTGFIDKSHFYCYVLFMMNKKASMQLRQENREFFMNLQNEFNDKLGIDSFLVQPIQRLTRYPLLLQQFISEFYKNGINCKPVLMSVCKLETRLRRLLEVVNQAEEIAAIEELDKELKMMELGEFKRSSEFEAYHSRSRKKYKAKAFLFENCLLCTEVRKKHLTYRQHYNWEFLDLEQVHSKSIKILLKGKDGFKDEYEFSAAEAITITKWLRIARRIVDKAKIRAAMHGKFSMPMHFVLGVVVALWLIWRY